MKKIITGLVVLVAGASLAACNRTEAPANDAAAETNMVVMPDENAAMPVDDNAAMTDNAAAEMDAVENVTEQGSTDH